MRRTLLQLMCALLLVFSATANDLFLSDSLPSLEDDLSTLLKNNDYSAKIKFLNSFYSPAYLGGLKSNSEDLLLDSIVVNEWSEELNRIEKSMLYTCRFEDEGETVLVDIKNWDPLRNIWINGSHNYYWFDEQGKLEEVEFQEYVSPEYRLYTKINYEYENGLLKYESKYDRIDEVEFWDELEQIEYQYYDNNLLKTVYTNEWDRYEVAWITNAYRTFKYDSTSVLKMEIGFDYNFTENSSEKKFELIYDYDSLGNMQEVVEFIPGWEEGPFVPERKQTNTYDESAKLESESYYNWDYDADGWNGEIKWLYNNEPDGPVLLKLNNYLWDTEKSKWVSNYMSEFTSDNMFLASEITDWDFLETYMPVYAFDDVVCDRIEIQKLQNDLWETIGFIHYHFSNDDLVGVNDRFENPVRVYPNPVVDVLYVETNNFGEMTCTVTNLYGQIILQDKVENREAISLQGLKSGFYFVEIRSGNRKIYMQKIVKN